MKICLNMIVKNEAAIIERCLRSVLPHISCAVICDTGSTDDTPSIVVDMIGQSLPLTYLQTEFRNFSFARNKALDAARDSTYRFDYLLLVDADMELQAEPHAFCGLEDVAYMLRQEAGGLSYWNTRVLHRDARAEYKGATHEYLSIEGGPTPRLAGPYFVDHVDGANRPDKFERDLRLLTEEHLREPSNPRTVFYLGQTCRDMGRYLEAARWYAKRAGMGAWPEEAWRAKLEESRCLRRTNG